MGEINRSARTVENKEDFKVRTAVSPLFARLSKPCKALLMKKGVDRMR